MENQHAVHGPDAEDIRERTWMMCRSIYLPLSCSLRPQVLMLHGSLEWGESETHVIRN